MILCDYSFADAVGKTCIIGAFDEIFARGLPVKHRHMSLAAKLHGAAAEVAQARVEILDPSGKAINSAAAFPISIGSKGTAALNVEFYETVLEVEGSYVVNLFVNEELAGKVPFNLILLGGASK
jgi:hypothetical protein